MTWRRRLKRRFGIAAPRVAVHTHVPWYMRWSLLLVIFSVVAAIAWAAYDLGRGMGGYDSSQASAEQARLAETVAHLQDENESLRDQLAVAERQMQIEQSTHGKLGIAHEEQSALGALTRRLFEPIPHGDSNMYAAILPNVSVRTPTADLLVTQLRVGALDAAVVYKANVSQTGDSIEVIPITEGEPSATQPIAVSKSSTHPYLAARLVKAISSAAALMWRANRPRTRSMRSK